MVAFGYRFGPVGRLLGVALLVVALDACADGNMTPSTMNSAAPLAVRDASSSRGTILAIRPTEAGVAGAGTSVLDRLAKTAAASPAAAGTGRPANGGQTMEFVVREESGATVAVVQTNEVGFRVGERVMILRGADHTYLSRTGV